jgi:hypothetical protein
MNGLSNKKKINDNNKEDGGGNLMEGEGRLSRLRPYLLLSNFSLSVFFFISSIFPLLCIGLCEFCRVSFKVEAFAGKCLQWMITWWWVGFFFLSFLPNIKIGFHFDLRNNI